MWDFGLLIYRGPLVVNPDIRFEPNVLRSAVTAASGVDHQLFADRFADAALAVDSTNHGPWTCIGGARFIEEYLDPRAVETTGYSSLLDAGLNALTQTGAIGVSFPQEVLTPRQRERLVVLC
jgi:hypothetical protein